MAEITIGPIEGPAPLPRTPGPARPGKSFGETLSESIAQVNELQKAAETAAQDLAVGKSKDIAQTLIAIEKASISFQLMMQVRNRMLEAYQEVMRMQV